MTRQLRDSAILYAVLAALVVVVAVITGGDVVLAAVLAVAAFVIAMGWNWWRFRARAQRESKPGP